jgi:hypothetical protein
MITLGVVACGTPLSERPANPTATTTPRSAPTTTSTSTTATPTTPPTTANQPIVQATLAASIAAAGSTVVLNGRCTWFGGGPAQRASAYLVLSKYAIGGPFSFFAHKETIDPSGDGSFTLDIVIPANAPPGEYHGDFDCGVDDMASGRQDVFTLTITAAATSAPIAEVPLPQTP